MAITPLAASGPASYRLPRPRRFAVGERRTTMTTKLSLLVRLEAKPGMEGGDGAMLRQGLELGGWDRTTPVWFALRLGPSTFGVFDAFADEAGRQAHLSGPIAQALMAQAPKMLASPPVIEPVEVLGAKLPEAA